MNSKLLGAAFGVAALLSVGSANAAVVYDAVTDFSILANSNGAWTYGEGTGPVFSSVFTKNSNNVPVEPISVPASVQYWQSSNPSLRIPTKSPGYNGMM